MNLNNQRWLKDLSVSSMEMGESELGFSSNAGDSSICLNFFLYFYKRKLIEYNQPMIIFIAPLKNALFFWVIFS